MPGGNGWDYGTVAMGWLLLIVWAVGFDFFV